MPHTTVNTQHGHQLFLSLEKQYASSAACMYEEVTLGSLFNGAVKAITDSKQIKLTMS